MSMQDCSRFTQFVISVNQITIPFDVLCLPILIACLILYFANLGLIIDLYHFPVEMFDIKFVSVEENEIVQLEVLFCRNFYKHTF